MASRGCTSDEKICGDAKRGIARPRIAIKSISSAKAVAESNVAPPSSACAYSEEHTQKSWLAPDNLVCNAGGHFGWPGGRCAGVP